VWETQGFKEYDGYGWYRVRFRVSSALLGRRLILLLGKIDDVDEVFLNGHRIGGTGSLRSDGPLLGEEYNQLRAYSIPSDRLLTGSDNVVAVRVYDRFMHGGIWDGPIGLIDRERYLLQQEGRRGGESWLRRLMDALFR
jgi:sialate O-acetylesterase